MSVERAAGYGLGRERFGLLFAVMLVAAAGNTAMQSLLPAIGRQLAVPDIYVAAAFSLSALLWVIAAPYWAGRADRRGRRALMRIGLYGFIGSMLACGLILDFGLRGVIPPAAVFSIFVLGRALYGAFGSASPSAVQAYIAARTRGPQRINALAAIVSSFGLGSVLGPAVAPLFIFPPLGLAAPMIVFAGIGVIVLVALIVRLPDDTPHSDARGAIATYPALQASSTAPRADAAPQRKLAWRDPRVRPWLLIGTIGGHGQAMILGVIGFTVIDRAGVPLAEAQGWIAIVLMAGAASSLLAQWWLIPQFALEPEKLARVGALLAAAGSALTGLSSGLYGLTMGFALASLGFGLFRPGFTAGASLAVEPNEQNAVAGMITSVIGLAFVAAPTIGIALYGLSRPAPFLLTTLLLLVVALLGLRRAGS